MFSRGTIVPSGADPNNCAQLSTICIGVEGDEAQPLTTSQAIVAANANVGLINGSLFHSASSSQ
jgi:hypothetical protein